LEYFGHPFQASLLIAAGPARFFDQAYFTPLCGPGRTYDRQRDTERDTAHHDECAAFGN